MHQPGNVFIHAAVHQHLLKRAAAANNQQHHGDNFNGIGDGAHDLIHAAAAIQTKGENRDQHRNQRSHNRIAKELGVGQQHMAFWQNHLRHRAQRHQNHRYQRGPDADTKARHLRFGKGFGIVEPFRDRLVDAFQKAGVNRAGQNHRGNAEQRAVKQRFAHVSVKQCGNRRGTRMRRQKAVSHRQRSSHRYANVEQRHARRRGNAEHQRQQQHKAHFIKQRKAHGETGQHQRPLNVLFAKLRNQRGGDALCAAAVGQ